MYGSNPLMAPAFGAQSQPMFDPRAFIRQAEPGILEAININADYSGCGHWRLLWPAAQLNVTRKGEIRSGSIPCTDVNWFRSAKSIRIQRQGHPKHIPYAKWLYNVTRDLGSQLIYEIDDIAIAEAIPDYNKFKTGFCAPGVREGIIEVMQNCDEITVTCEYMKEFYKDITGNTKITVLPNYMPKKWIGNFYDEKKIARNFNKNKKKPRILYPGSPSHFDTQRRCKGKDDFYHVNDAVIKTRKKFQWVFFGGYPEAVQKYIKDGTMEYIPWGGLDDYPEKASKLNATVMVAPLQDNTFNRAKSNIKLLEAGALGMPCICQDLVTYKDADLRFTTGDEMVDLISKVTKDGETYMKSVRKHRYRSDQYWLESTENLDKFVELYGLPYGHKDRILLNKLNGL